MAYTIALVEDDEMLRANYTQALQREGYLVDSYRSRPEAEAAFARKLPDMAILDVMLLDEKEGGFELCRQLRQLSPTIPIIFLTARDSDLDRVSGLRLGAWDYLTKNTTTLDFLPVRISSLFKMVESLKGKTDIQETVIESGSLRIVEERKQIYWQEQLLNLTLTEYWLLLALARRPGHVKSHEQLMEAANVVVTNNAITAHIRRIRDKIQEIDPDFNAIRTEYGMGYRWQA
ncbi:response regulator [Desulfopila aestuarii]|uniref:Two-component system, OmpR family, response regulator n=1 Tax=Desulfopila aestuarii DSM 18488 TaxID=1121416 RepID=A0A1M7XX02_9BACT|nr:response regulator [Desulfopila aestuarii]SHO43211.1 two-component system, OmpR family, response regulator [Desulfopila aestuarii DSM 18488]